MKKYFILMIVVLFLTSCGSFRLLPVKVDETCAIKKETVPNYISSSFKDKYPGITPEQWYLKHGARYIVRFMQNGSTTYAVYNKNGMFSEEEVDDPDYDEFYDEDDLNNWDYGDNYY